MAFDIQRFTGASSLKAPSPELTFPIDPHFKIVGGGAVIDYTGNGSLLTASYPMDLHTWYARGKDHTVSDKEVITVHVLGLNDPNDDWDVIIVKGVSLIAANHPWARAVLPEGYVLTGGGAFVDWHHYGNLLTASYPCRDDGKDGPPWNSWEARSKDHEVADPCIITAYAIGIRASCTNSRHPTVTNNVVSVSSTIEAHPTCDGSGPGHPQACLSGADFYVRSGGGAIDKWEYEGSRQGNLLTASYPDPKNELCWVAKGKDHNISSQSYITSYVIGIVSLP